PVLATHCIPISHPPPSHNDPPPPALYPLSLHDALPICIERCPRPSSWPDALEDGPRAQETVTVYEEPFSGRVRVYVPVPAGVQRSEEHTTELQSPYDLVCRLLLEKKKNKGDVAGGAVGK